MTYAHRSIPATCQQCGKIFYPVYASQGKFCSQACNGAFRQAQHTVAERFWSKVCIAGPDECWLWTAATRRDGYGYIGLGGRKGGAMAAHRFSYELAHGPIPAGMFVCHTCDVRRCVNPAHLWLGTMFDNIADRDQKGRVRHGSPHPCAKLTEDDVRTIRLLRETAGLTYVQIAARYGVDISSIYAIIKRKNWKHVA